MSEKERLVCVEGVVYREWYTHTGKLDRYQLVTPKNPRPLIMSVAHDGVMGGYLQAKRLHRNCVSCFIGLGW